MARDCEIVCYEVRLLGEEGQWEKALKQIDDFGASAVEAPDLWVLKAKCLEKLKREDDDFYKVAYEVFKISRPYRICICNYRIGCSCRVELLSVVAEGHLREGEYDLACDMFEIARDHCSKENDKKFFEKKYDSANKMVEKPVLLWKVNQHGRDDLSLAKISPLKGVRRVNLKFRLSQQKEETRKVLSWKVDQHH